ncbi:MAG: hypothetical protein Q8K66_11265 [Sediminibacterium sp.]|nr:hypothetical protein [Sediminibacterium sp.]MDP3128434.1 hypothetical protein [Sediminibacterium sp.]
MNKIASIHQKILDSFIRRMKDDPTFYFAPRKINNKNRLTESYCTKQKSRSFLNGCNPCPRRELNPHDRC